MVQRLAAVLGSLDENAEVLHHLVLPGKVLEAQRAQRLFEVAVWRTTLSFPQWKRGIVYFIHSFTSSRLMSPLTMA